MRWLEWIPRMRGGHHYRLNAVPRAEKTYYYVNYTLKNFSMRRLIMNTPPGRATPEKWDYHDYRKVALTTEADPVFKGRTKFKGHTPVRERRKFRRLLAERLTKALVGKRKLPGLNITSKVYLDELERWFDLADQMYERQYGKAVAE